MSSWSVTGRVHEPPTTRARIVGVGAYAPRRILTSGDLVLAGFTWAAALLRW